MAWGTHCVDCYPGNCLFRVYVKEGGVVREEIELGVAPTCVRQCPGRAIWFGLLDDEEGPVAKLVRTWGAALPLHPEYGTEPNVFYIPPIGPARLHEDGRFDETVPPIPTEYVESLFGPKVNIALDILRAEMAKTSNGGKSELLDTRIAYQWKDMFKPFDRDPAEIEWQ